MLMKGEPTLMTMRAPVRRISSATAPVSMPSSAWVVIVRPWARPLSLTESTMASAFAWVRFAMWMSPNSSAHSATLWATTCATPPAPMMRTLGFSTAAVSFSGSGQGCRRDQDSESR